MGKPRLQQWFEWQESQKRVSTYTDADWAGCKETRKSTTGGVITIGKHALKGWSKTQQLVALSSRESELYATPRASAETLRVILMYKDFGLLVEGEIWGDASAALDIINRNGLGKTRYIQRGLLWVQQVAAEKRLAFGKVLGKANPADLYATYLDTNTIDQHVRELQYKFSDGRAAEAPKLYNINISIDEYQMMGLWSPWEWLDVITDAVIQNSNKIKNYGRAIDYKREVNILSNGEVLLRSLIHKRKSESKETRPQQLLHDYTFGHVGIN